MTQPVQIWPSKDPDAVLDYTYRIPLDPNDSIAPDQAVLTKLSGDVVLDNVGGTLAATPDTVDGVYGQVITAWLSGGTDGETALFQVTWTTVATRKDDALIQLPVASAELVALALTGYAKPLPGHLIARYPAFASVPASTVQAWLTDAERFVDTGWSEGDYAAGLMSLAAHNMALLGLGTDGAALAGVPAGISRFRSGSLDVSMTEQAANARMTGDFTATRYGQEYVSLLRRNRGGPLVADTGILPQYAGYPPFGLGWPY